MISATNIGKSVVIILLLMLSVFGAGKTFANKHQQDEKFTELIQDIIDKENFMGSVLVAQKGKILFDESFGFRDLDNKQPINPQTTYKIASITKQFTAVAILLLEQQGKLSLTENVNHFLKNPVLHWEEITIEHLLKHSSGIPNYTNRKSYHDLKQKRVLLPELIKFIAEEPLNFPPDSDYEYSNSGYVLLGYIIEQVSGLTFQNFIEKHIFGPLNMSNSGFVNSSGLIQNAAIGYRKGENGLIKATDIDMSTVFSAGNILSTTIDLYKWTVALYEDDFLSNQVVDKIIRQANSKGAYGVFASKNGEYIRYYHSGGIDGFNSEWIYIPQEQLVIIVMSNVQSLAVQNLGHKLADIVSGKSSKLTLKSHTKYQTHSELSQFVATYQMEKPGINTHIISIKDKLYALLPGTPLIELSYLGNNTFHSNSVGLTISFGISNTNRENILIKFDARDLEVKGTKLSFTSEQSELNKYIGTYEVRNNFYITVFNTKEGLFAQATGDMPVKLLANGSDSFSTNIPRLSVKFSKDSPTSYLILKQGANKAKARRIS